MESGNRAQSSQELSSCRVGRPTRAEPGVGGSGAVAVAPERGVRRGPERADSPCGRSSHWTGRGGAGDTRGFSSAPPAPARVLRSALGVAAASSPPRLYRAPPCRALTCSGHPRRGSSLRAAPCPYRRHATPPGPSALHSGARTAGFDGKVHPVRVVGEGSRTLLAP